MGLVQEQCLRMNIETEMNSKNDRPLIGVLIGIGVGVALYVGTGNLGVGIGVGIGVGSGLAIIFGGGAMITDRARNHAETD